MMICNDFAGAREHLLQAHSLFPQIDNVVSMITLCDILVASKIKFPGCGIDPYWVLQVTPSATFADIGCQYQKLVTVLQPIRKIFPCTALALKLLLDALTVLGDQKKRPELDFERITRWKNYKSSDLHASINQHNLKKQSISTSQCSSASSSQVCDGGSILPEMYTIDVATSEANQVNLIKQQIEIGVEELISSPANLKCGQKTPAVVDKNEGCVNWPPTLQTTSLEEILCPSKATQQKRSFQDFYNFDSDRKFQHFEAGQIWAVNYRASLGHSYQYARIDSTSRVATCVTWLKPIPVSSTERRWCDLGLPVACGSFEASLEMQMSIESRWPMIVCYKCAWDHGVTNQSFEIYPKRGEVWAVYKDWNLEDWSYNPDSVNQCKFELVEIISDFSKYLGTYGAYLIKSNGFSSIFERQTIGENPVTLQIPPNNLYVFSHKVPAYKFKGGEFDKIVEGMYELDQLALPDCMIQHVSAQPIREANFHKVSEFAFTGQLPSLKSFPGNKILIPSWSERDFVMGQVWAVYWGKDFMPRNYVRVNDILSEDKVSVTFLEPLPVLDHEIEWIKQDHPMGCGIFKVGERNANIGTSLFSYLVRCGESSSKSCYKIYPQKGQVWAMYKGWNANWKMAGNESFECHIVHILSDFSEEDEITICRLGEVKGCLTFFQKQQYDGFDLIHRVPRLDMLSFSHRIPAFKVPGVGKYGIPEGSWHLEPLALPTK